MDNDLSPRGNRRAVFVDRDGTLVREKEYLGDPLQLEWEEGSLEAIRLLNRAGLAVVLVTNQSGAARGYYTLEQVGAVHQALRLELERSGARLDGVYFCPHHPEGTVAPLAKECSCRKPGTGMIATALRDLGLTCAGSFLIGDKLTDMETARRAGLSGILVMTGYGRSQWRASLNDPDGPLPERVTRNLLEAVLWVLHETRVRGLSGTARAPELQNRPGWSCKWASLVWLKKRVTEYRSEGKKIVVANGIFDLLHAGHVGHLEAARALGDVLIVAVNSDATAGALKGPGRPIVPADERVEVLSALRCVDYCLVFSEKTLDRTLEELRPDFHAKGTDYREASVPERETVRRYGGKVCIVGPPESRASCSLLARLTR